jgi:hypothetical protein
MVVAFRSASVLAVFGVLAGCAGSPGLTPEHTGRVVATTDTQVMRSYDAAVSSSVAVNAPPDKVLAALKSAYSDLGIEVKLLDPPHGQIGNRNFSRTRRLAGEPLSTYVGCGSTLTGEAADTYRVTMELISQVTPESAGSRLQTWLTAAAQDLAATGDKVSCLSRGTLEAKVNALAMQRLGS